MAETVAFLFSDLAGSTALLADLGADTYGEVLSAYRDAVEKAAAEHDGEVVDREGDGIFLVFPTAAGAIRAAADAQRSLAEADWPEGAAVVARMGVHVGEAQRHEDGWVGLDVHRAARVGSAANGGQVVVSEAARAVARDALSEAADLRDLGEHRLEGLEHRERLYQLVAPGLAEDFPPLRTLEGVANNLPVQPTSFIGRERELAKVADLARDNRLVTLTGVGGAGKTRLALEASTRLVTGFPDGVWLVELAAVTDPEAVPREVASALGIREREEGDEGTVEEQLVAHLADRELLLVVDNCEHLLAAVAGLADRLLRSCPDVHLLATSREGLGIAGERIWQVPSLTLPDTEGSDIEEADAVRLFVDRAQAVAPSFDPSHEDLRRVARICRRLDGIPLAIELAAARIRVLGLERLADRLDDRFRVLTGGSRTALPRQQTLAATIDWSYQLLDEAERLLFTRLSVFAGSFTLEAAEEVCSGDGIDEPDVLDLLSSLVDKSMVVTVEVDGETRHRLLETLRVYARDRLTDTDHADEVRRRHRDHYLHLAEQVEAHLHGSEHRTWSERVATERENLRAALDWSRDRDDDHATSVLASTVASHWHDRGHYRRALTHLRTALDHTHHEPEREAELRGRLASSLYSVGDADGALAEAERAHALVVDGEPSAVTVRALTRLSSILRVHPNRDPRLSVPPAREAVAAARSVDDRLTEVRALNNLGGALTWTGDIDEGVEHLREALTIAREVDDPTWIVGIYAALFNTLQDYGRRGDEARVLADEVLSWLDAEGDHGAGTSSLIGHLANTFLRTGEWDRCEEALARMAASHHLEGFAEAWFVYNRGALRWMQGRLEEAAGEAAALRALDIPRWNHDLFPLEAEVAAFDGRIGDVRAVADEYLAFDVDPSEEAMKTAVLRPLVHAEVDAALATEGAQHDEHLRRARGALDRLRSLIEDFPRLTTGAIQFEVPETNLVLAEAELSRVTGPDPEVWAQADAQVFYAYWKLYCRWRRAEALLAVGERDEGEQVLRAAHAEASEIGADLIRRELESLSPGAGIRDPGAG